jgi:hypothetical protein
MGTRVLLETGRRYRATLRLGWLQGSAATDSMITDKLRDAGFVDVQAWGSGRDRYASGEWGGATLEVELPEEVTLVEAL